MSHDLDDEELEATRRLLGLEKEGIEKNIKNLKEYIKEDDIYTRYKNGEYNELSDFEMFCINHCKDIEVVLGNLDALCDMQRTADIELKNARKMNEEYKKTNKELRKEIKKKEQQYFDEIDKKVDIILLYNSLLDKIKNKIKETEKEENLYAKNNIVKILEELLPKEDK